MKKTLLIISFVLLYLGVAAQQKAQYRITKQYVNLPVSNSAPEGTMTINSGGHPVESFTIRLTSGEPEFWVCHDMSKYKGQSVTISYDKSDSGLDNIVFAQKFIDAQKLYKEPMRQQFHFTPQYGRLGDPNGLVYVNGEYHLFYQHNPYGPQFANMSWGHAVSRDLVNWEILPLAIPATPDYMAYSGSAIIDYDNVAGLNKGDKPAMLIYYTQRFNKTPERTQCLAYSLDDGRTVTSYEGNPIIKKTNFGSARDPKVIYHKPSKHWVMIVLDGNGHSIYTSTDLRKWDYQSHIYGFYECPDLIELPVDGDKNNTKWVIWGGSGVYMIGDFDGRKFTPQSEKQQCVIGGFAAQTYSNIPASDGRCISFTMWNYAKTWVPSVSRSFALPQEMTLRTTPYGVRMFANPARELNTLCNSVGKWDKLTRNQANDVLSKFGNESKGLRIRGAMRVAVGWGGLKLNGQQIAYRNISFNTINGIFYNSGCLADDEKSLWTTFDIWIDRLSVESFIDNGARAILIQRDALKQNKKLEFYDSVAEVRDLEVMTVDAAIPECWLNK